MNFDYHIPTKIIFGAGRLKELASVDLPGEKALVVTTKGTVQRGLFRLVESLLKSRGVECLLFDKIIPNPILSHVQEAAELARSCDFVIGLGGGSAMDSAKAVALVAANGGNFWDYVYKGSGKGKKVEKPSLPLVTISTTAATGTESDPWAVITNSEKNEKVGFGCLPYTYPLLSIMDPELTLSVPPYQTACQGFDVLFHAVEGYLANIATPISDLYALKAVELASAYLPAACKDGKNLEARTQLMYANMLSGFVQSTSDCISIHSMEHVLSALHPSLTHGAGLIMLSASYYRFWINHCPERMKTLAAAMGLDVQSLSAREGALRFVETLEQLKKECGVDSLKMSDFSIKKEDLAFLAKKARKEMSGTFALDPKPLSYEETLGIMEEAYA